VKRILSSLPDTNVENVFLTGEAELVAKKYIDDAVKFQLEVREELSEKYSSNREAFLRELKERYGNLQKQKASTHIR
jgi:hypothetical protein